MFESRRIVLSLALLAIAGAPLRSRAGEVKLKNGMTLYGTASDRETLVDGAKPKNKLPTTTYTILMVETPLQRYFVPRLQALGVNKNIDLSKTDVFEIRQQKRTGGSRVIAVVGDFRETPRAFDDYGRRIVKLRDSSGKLDDIIQGVTRITPEYLKISALNYTWDTALATSSVPVEILDPMLRRANKSNDAEHRLKIARFYIAAQLYRPALRELEAIAREHTGLADKVADAKAVLTEAMARDLVSDLRLRRAAGQHQLVYEASKKFPVEDVPAPLLREVREITAEYDAARERAAQAQSLMADLQAQLGDDPHVAELAPCRAEISEQLYFGNLDRLDAFLKLSIDPKLKADEKLALALSGWVVGSANAVTDLGQSLRFWQARFLALDYLRSAAEGASERKAALERLEDLEGVGPVHMAQMLPLLPPALETPGAAPGKALRIVVDRGPDEEPAAYWVLLPAEYHPDHSCPLIVALHSEKRGPQPELEFWGGNEQRAGQSQRHGYIVIAPEYSTRPGQTQYEYSPTAHRIVLDALCDARRRFNIDSDRVFLAGHDMGGDAAFDIGFSHPDQFAGVIPIAGVSDRYSEFYWENARYLPLYVVCGELDRDTVARNARTLTRMMLHGHQYDLIVSEYVGAGADSFYSEIHKLFDWMSRHRRVPLPKDFEVKTLRETDNHFYWYEFSGIPRNVTNVAWEGEKRGAVRPMKVRAILNQSNTFEIQSGAERHRIWLTPGGGHVDFDKRVGVRINGRQRFNDFIKPDAGAMLERFRLYGDRQQIFWAVRDF